MTQYGWANCPETIRNQVERFVVVIRENMTSNLIGVYLHGSLAMGCFTPERGDVDLLVVAKHGMTVETKHHIAEFLLAHSGSPNPLEVSFLRESDLDPWTYPTPFDLHYSETWREQYERYLESGEWRKWNEKQYKDPDLAAHITITRQRGISLYGHPIDDVFPPVPKEHYVASLMNDFERARDDVADAPVYGILNMCRVYWYLCDARISSKEEAGVWAIGFLPAAYRNVVAQALQVYRGNQDDTSFDGAALKAFADYVDAQVRTLIARKSG